MPTAAMSRRARDVDGAVESCFGALTSAALQADSWSADVEGLMHRGMARNGAQRLLAEREEKNA